MPPPPHTHTYGEGWGIARLKCSNYFLIVLSVQGQRRGFDIRILTPGRCSTAMGRAKSQVLTSSLSPGGGAHSRALKAEKSLSLPFPAGGGGGAVVTNDWCIICKFSAKG